MLRTEQPLRRPLVGIALSMSGGLCMAAYGGLAPKQWIMASIVCIFVTAYLVRRRLPAFVVFVLVGCISGLWFLAADANPAVRLLNERSSLSASNTSVIGRVSGAPRFYPFKSGSLGMWVFPLHLEGVQDGDVWHRQMGDVDVRVMGETEHHPSALEGQRVWLQGQLEHRDYKGGLPVGLKISSPENCSMLPDAGFSLIRWSRSWRESAAFRLEQGIEDKTGQLAVLRSLVLGYRNEIPEEIYACFRRTGSLHIFAISGLHVGIVGLLLIAALKTMGVPRDWFGVCLLPLLFMYVAATGMKSSAMRAMVMAGVFLIAPLFRRKPDIPTSVAFAALLLLLLNPMEIKSAGFVFSFVVVAFIVMVYSIIPESMLRGGWLRNYGVSLTITSLAAGLASIPLTAYLFERFSPVSLVGNLAVVPLTFCIVLSGWLSILIPFASTVFNHAALAFINLMVWSVETLDGLPGSSFAIEAPPLGAVLLWYGSLVYLLVHAVRGRQRILGLAGTACSILWAVLI